MINRREVLKLIAAAGVVAAAPGLSIPEALEPNQLVGRVRELRAFVLTRLEWVMSWDIRTDTEQFGVDATCWDIEPNTIESARSAAVAALAAVMRKRGITVADLRPLTIPHGFDGGRFV